MPVFSAHVKMFDNTQLSTYKDCPRKYFLRHKLNWKSEGTAIPLVFGLSWHAGQDALWTNPQAPNAEKLDAAMEGFLTEWETQGMSRGLSLAEEDSFAPRTPGVAREMYYNYIQERHHILANCEVVAIEQPLAFPLPKMDNIWYIGRLDKTVRYNGQLIVLEHKTTTAYRINGFFDPNYIEGWYTDAQVKGYQAGATLSYKEDVSVWVDCALVHKKVHNGFTFVAISHQFPILQEWLEDTTNWVQRILADEQRFEASQSLQNGVFPKNENSCMGKFGPCSYLDICRTCSNPERLKAVPEGYKVEAWEPFSVLGLDKLIQQAKGELKC